MTTITRTDIHRPSAIQPEEYQFIGFIYLGQGEREVGELMMLAEERKRIRQHMEMTGGRYSDHEHGGSCHICGAAAMYLAVYYHHDTNAYIQTGEDCANKMDFGDTEGFTPLRRAIKNALEAKAGKLKAQRILSDDNLSRAWEIYQMDANPNTIHGDSGGWEFNTLRDIVKRLVQWGSLSTKQTAFLHVLVDKIDNWAARKAEETAKRAAENELAEDIRQGAQHITGHVLTIKLQDSYYGETLKMLVKDLRGFKVWGTVPSILANVIERGDKITFRATVSPSDDDPKFGFYKRPTQACKLSN